MIWSQITSNIRSVLFKKIVLKRGLLVSCTGPMAGTYYEYTQYLLVYCALMPKLIGAPLSNSIVKMKKKSLKNHFYIVKIFL